MIREDGQWGCEVLPCGRAAVGWSNVGFSWVWRESPGGVRLGWDLSRQFPCSLASGGRGRAVGCQGRSRLTSELGGSGEG